LIVGKSNPIWKSWSEEVERGPIWSSGPIWQIIGQGKYHQVQSLKVSKGL
jgi:hypothetical protein